MDISASATITVRIDGKIFELTTQEAETLYNALGKALNKQTHQPFSHPVGIRSGDLRSSDVFTR